MNENLLLSIAVLGRFLTVLRLILIRDKNIVSPINRMVWESPTIKDVYGQCSRTRWAESIYWIL